MFDIKLLNKISQTGLSIFDEKYNCADDIENPDAIMVRSASLHDMELPSCLKAIARAGAGTNKIPIDRCSAQGIVVFNTPGANANAVKELVLAALFLSSRKVYAGMQWVQGLKDNEGDVGKMVEKGKGAYVGPEIMGKTLGLVGLGAIGALVANSAIALGMNVVGYDPFLTVNAALHLSPEVELVSNLDELYAKADYISVHVPLNSDTKGFINKDSIAKMKDGVRLINFARAGLIDDNDLIEALSSGKVSSYVVDFPTEAILGVENVTAIPHLGASTPESEENCARMAAVQLKNFLETGNIKNSVNMPAFNVARPAGTKRVAVVFMSSADFDSIEADGAVNRASKIRGGWGYGVIDVTGDAQAVAEKAAAVQGVVRAFVIE